MSLSVDKALRQAQSHLNNGELAEAESLYKQVLSKFPKNKKAIQGYRKLKAGITSEGSLNSDPPQEQTNELISFYNQGRFEEVLSNVKSLLDWFPKAIVLYNLQGASNAALQRLDAAINSYKHALKIKPDHAESYNNMGTILKDRGDLDMAINSFKQALKIKPDYAEAYYNLGLALQDKGDLDMAIQSYKQALNIKPDYAQSYNNMGNALNKKGERDVAIESYKNAIKIKPDYAEAFNNMGVALKERNDPSAALESFKQALKIKPDYAEAYLNMGNTLKDKQDLDAAIDCYNQAVKINPNYPEAYNNMGTALQEKGDLNTAINCYKQALKIKPSHTETHLNISAIKKYDVLDMQILQMKAQYTNHRPESDDRCNICFALAKASEDLENLEEAFDYLKEGNAIRKKNLSYDIKVDQILFKSIKKADQAAPYIPYCSFQKIAEIIPVFILGMPRSGTTLIEQIVSSHSEVTGAGELNFIDEFGFKIITGEQQVNEANLRRFRDQYLNGISQVSDGSSFVTDKMPHNFRAIGLISRALPEAKIIHVKRDAAATCWSSFKQFFAVQGLGYCYDLSDVVKYFELYDNLMQFWRERYADRIYEVNYDQLTFEQESKTRGIIHHLELDWQEACLSPHENSRSVRTASQNQVREKIYRDSSQQWRKFEPFLNGAFDVLADFKSQPSDR